MKIRGEMVICDRCGESVFRKFKEEKEYDGGWTRVEIYEELPKGWGLVGSSEYMYVCPKCRAEYDALWDEWKDKERKWREAE